MSSTKTLSLEGCEKIRIALKSKPVFHNLLCSEDAFAFIKTYADPQGSRPEVFTEPLLSTLYNDAYVLFISW